MCAATEIMTWRSLLLSKWERMALGSCFYMWNQTIIGCTVQPKLTAPMAAWTQTEASPGSELNPSLEQYNMTLPWLRAWGGDMNKNTL